MHTSSPTLSRASGRSGYSGTSVMARSHGLCGCSTHRASRGSHRGCLRSSGLNTRSGSTQCPPCSQRCSNTQRAQAHNHTQNSNTRRTEASGMMAGLPCPGAATKAAGGSARAKISRGSRRSSTPSQTQVPSTRSRGLLNLFSRVTAHLRYIKIHIQHVS